MQITCPNCQKSLLLDDAKLPAQAVRLKCPACGGAIPFAPPAPTPPAPASHGSAAEDGGAPGDLPTPGSPQWERLKREVVAEVLRHMGIAVAHDGGEADDEDGGDQKKALICEDEVMFQVVVREAVEKLGFKADVAASMEEAIGKVGRESYDLVTVDNRLPDDPEGGYKILQAINAQPPEQRRKMFVAFISADLSTMDTNSAFILGANLTVAKKDVKRLDRIIADGLRDHRRTYATYFQVAEEIQEQEV